MDSRETYVQLFREDMFEPYDVHASSVEYVTNRHVASRSLKGINYYTEEDRYATMVATDDNHYQLNVIHYEDIIDAIMAYDRLANAIGVLPYIEDGTRTHLGASKYFNKFNREYIANNIHLYSGGQIARQLEIPAKEVDKYIVRVHGKQQATNPTLVVWDVRDKYEDMTDVIKSGSIITDEDIDALIGLV